MGSPTFFRCALTAVLVTACSAGGSAPTPTTPQAARQTITILHVADLHAQLEPHLELFFHDGKDRIELAGGFARVAAAIRHERAARGANVLVLDGGDTIQGSGAAALTKGAAVVGPLTALGIDVALPGNWEVVYGAETLRTRARELPYPMIAANIRDAKTGERLFPPYAIREVGGVRVGILGYTDPDVPRRQPPTYSAGLTYDGPEELPALARELREKHGAAVVILMSHIGLSKAVALTPSVPGIDIHLSADTHERTYKPIDVGGTLVVEPGAFGSFLGRFELTVEGGRVVDRRWELVELTAAKFPEAADVREHVTRALAPHRQDLDAVVGQVAGTLARYDVVETSLDAVLADALRDATGTEIALSNGFRFGSPITEGPVRQADLWNVYPVVTRLKIGTVTGRQLREFWERELENVFSVDATKRFGGWLPRPSGMTVRFRAGAPAGQRLIELRVGGVPLEDAREYTITACEREGDAPDMLCRMPKVKGTRVMDIDAHEAVRRYLRRGPVTPPKERRVEAVDLPAVVRTQALELTNP